MSKELKRPNRDDYYDMLGGFMPVIWDIDIEEYINQIESKLQEAEGKLNIATKSCWIEQNELKKQ